MNQKPTLNFDLERMSIGDTFRKSLNYSLISLDRMNQIISILTKIKSNYEKESKLKPESFYITTSKTIEGYGPTKPVSPGLPGNNLDYFIEFCKFTDRLFDQWSQINDTISTDLIGPLKRYSSDFSKKLDIIVANEKQLEAFYDHAHSKYVENFNNLNSLYLNAVKIEDKISHPGFFSKNVDKLVSDLRTSIILYTKASRETEISAASLNYAQMRYISDLNGYIYQMQTLEKDKQDFFTNIFSSVIPHFRDILQSPFRQDFIDFLNPDTFLKVRKNDFISFIQLRGFTRTMPVMKHFSTIPMSWADDVFVEKIETYRPCTLEIPIAVATALYDFESSVSKQLSFKKGDNISLFDFGYFDWNLGYIGKKGNCIGYVPSSLIKVDGRKTALVTSPYVKVSEDELTVRSGELVFVSDDQPEDIPIGKILCRDMEDNIGYLPKDYLYFD